MNYFPESDLVGDTDEDHLVTTHHDQHGQLTDPIAARQFIRAGHAIFTLVSTATGARFTYKVCASDDGNVHFVSVLNGPDNGGDYSYLGIIRRDLYAHGAKSKVGTAAKSVVAFKWAWQMLAQGHMPRTLEIWHEGACGRCGRRLTVPASVASGYGPECITKLGM